MCSHQILKSTLEPVLKFTSANSLACSKLLFRFVVVGFCFVVLVRVWLVCLFFPYSGRTLAKMEPGLSERMEISKETVIEWAAKLVKHRA